jgi:two-component system phosphate regulon sensor histidine kinase PhoR
VLRTGRPRIEPEVTQPLRRALTHDMHHALLLQRLGFESLLVVPLRAHDHMLGAVTLVRGAADERFGSDDLVLANSWASQCALALECIARYLAERQAHLEAETIARQRTAALEQIADAIVIANERGQIDFMNPAARALFGSGETSAPRAVPLFGANGQALVGRSHPLARAGREHTNVSGTEVRVHQPGGEERVLEAFAAPLDDVTGQQARAVLSMHDVTAWRERELQRDESFANASHDLRTPVAAISGAIEVFLRDAPAGIPPPLYHMLLIIEQETARMRALVDDVLELTGVEAGRVQLRCKLTDVRGLARQAARAIEPLADERRQHLVVDLPARAVRLNVDAERLGRALLNLLSNAQEYAPDGGTIRLALARRAKDVLLSVADNGPGIPATEQTRIFERFYRGPGARSHRGSGLGLPIAQAMVELHGGRVWVESEPGAGAVFYVSLPGS